MKKIIISILLFIMFLPLVVNAKTCDLSDIKIESIELNNIIGNAEEINTANIKENKINLDLKLYDPGDSIEYNLKVKNNSKDDLFFDEDSLKPNSNYIKYNFSYEDNSNVIKSKSTKLIKLKVSYNNRVSEDKLINDTYNDINKITLKLSDKKIINPNTKKNGILFIIIILISSLIIFAFYKHKISINHMILLIGITIIIPNSVYALCNYNIEIETKIQIDGKEAYFLTGSEVNIKIKELAGNDTSTNGDHTSDQNITFIKNSTNEPDSTNKEDKNIVSLADSPYPIYMWFDNGTIYWWSEDKTPNINENASFMFLYLTKLENFEGFENFDLSRTKNIDGMLGYNISLKSISGLENWNTSNVTSMKYVFGSYKGVGGMIIEDLTPLSNWDVSNVTSMRSMFQYCPKVKNLHGLENWNVSNVTDMNSMFYRNRLLTNLNQLAKWDVSNVDNMSGIFQECTALTDISALKNWNVSNVTDMSYVFMGHHDSGNMALEDLSPIANWNVSNVTNLQGMFCNETALKDLTPLAEWNVSNVTNMKWLFAGELDNGLDMAIEDLSPLANWNVSNLEDMGYIFRNCNKLKNLHGLENWNVSNVTNMNASFANLTSLEDASAINDWNITHDTAYSGIFFNTPVHPEFSKVLGTWNNGTFIPN